MKIDVLQYWNYENSKNVHTLEQKQNIRNTLILKGPAKLNMKFDTLLYWNYETQRMYIHLYKSKIKVRHNTKMTWKIKYETAECFATL